MPFLGGGGGGSGSPTTATRNSPAEIERLSIEIRNRRSGFIDSVLYFSCESDNISL